MSIEILKPFERAQLWPIPKDEDYGIAFPDGTNQLIKELIAYKLSMSKRRTASEKGRFYHAVNIIRMLWGNKDCAIEVEWFNEITQSTEIITNNYFINTLKALSTGENWFLTGPASSAKTFCCSIHGLISFYSMPTETTVMITTTSGSSADRRTWAEVKKLHTHARFSDWMDQVGKNPPSIGSVVEYLKCITFNIDEHIAGKTATARDIRNGIIVIPVANDSTGEHALSTIIGTKNTSVIWIVDEMPEMMDGIMGPRSNLVANERFQFIGIGNAKNMSDAHGKACEPIGGWGAVDFSVDRVWQAKTGNVLFLHGEESPNDHPAISSQQILEVSDYPFPYLSNPTAREQIAIFEDENGDIEEGKKSAGYKRFAVGIWRDLGEESTILSAAFVRRFSADQEPLPFGPYPIRKIWGLDPAFTSQGDNNALTIITVGRDINGNLQIVFPENTNLIKPLATTKEDHAKSLADKAVKTLFAVNAGAADGAMDIMNDGGIVFDELTKAFGESGITPLSSLGKSEHVRYSNLVTQYWFNIRMLIASGHVRGFNINSNYSKDLFARQFETVSRGKVEVETKRDMKKRIKRSPDCGDSVSYAVEKLRLLGYLVKEDSLSTKKAQYPDLLRLYSVGYARATGEHASSNIDYSDILC